MSRIPVLLTALLLAVLVIAYRLYFNAARSLATADWNASIIRS